MNESAHDHGLAALAVVVGTLSGLVSGGVAVLAATRPVRPPAVSGLCATRDLPAGTTIAADDLEVRQPDPCASPAQPHAEESSTVVGQTLALAVGAHEPIRRYLLLGPSSSEACRILCPDARRRP